MVYIYGVKGLRIWGERSTDMGSKDYIYGVKVYGYGVKSNSL